MWRYLEFRFTVMKHLANVGTMWLMCFVSLQSEQLVSPYQRSILNHMMWVTSILPRLLSHLLTGSYRLILTHSLVKPQERVYKLYSWSRSNCRWGTVSKPLASQDMSSEHKGNRHGRRCARLRLRGLFGDKFAHRNKHIVSYAVVTLPRNVLAMLQLSADVGALCDWLL
jgi:hypothetical protein